MEEDFIIFRIVLSVILGGIIGIEREIKRKPAGLITLTLVCLGATMIAILQTKLNIDGDSTRLSAQVISGVGFIGGGTIIYNRGSVQGLTTAALLWINACLGLIIGYGFIKLALTSFLMIFIILIIMRAFEERIIHRRKKIKLYLTLNSKDCIHEITDAFSRENSPVKLSQIKWIDLNLNLLECTFSLDRNVSINTLKEQIMKNKNIKCD